MFVDSYRSFHRIKLYSIAFTFKFSRTNKLNKQTKNGMELGVKHLEVGASPWVWRSIEFLMLFSRLR